MYMQETFDGEDEKKEKRTSGEEGKSQCDGWMDGAEKGKERNFLAPDLLFENLPKACLLFENPRNLPKACFAF